MRKVLAALSGLSLLGALATAAIAARPARDKQFTGSGGDYMNNAPKWRREATGRFSFATSHDGGRILKFRGSYTYYCGKGTATLTAGYVTVTTGGAFDYRFSQRVKGGVDYVRISGSFSHDGKSANVDYVVDLVGKGKKVRYPYDTAHPHSLGCTSWVRGTAKTK